MALDYEGKSPKDLSPYNSPVYKLLIQFEHEKLRRQNEEKWGEVRPAELEVVHHYVSKRNYESPK